MLSCNNPTTLNKYVIIYSYNTSMVIDESFEKFLKCNESKDVVIAYEMPAVLGLIMTLYYLLFLIYLGCNLSFCLGCHELSRSWSLKTLIIVRTE